MADAVRSFKDAIAEILVESRNQGETGDILTRAKQEANQQYRDMVARHEFQEAIKLFTVTIDATAQTDATWPQLIGQAPMDIQYIKENTVEVYNDDGNTASYTPLVVKSHEEFMQYSRGLHRSSTDGRPLYIALHRIEGVRQELIPTSATTASFESSSVADVTPKRVILWGYLDSAERRRVSFAAVLTGTTPVASTGTNFARLLYASKDSDTTGEIIIKHSTSEVARIMPKERTSKYQVFALWPFAELQYKVRLECKIIPPMLSDDADVPWCLPGPFHGAWIKFTSARLLEVQEDSDADKVRKQAEREEVTALRTHRPHLYQTPRIRMSR